MNDPMTAALIAAGTMFVVAVGLGYAAFRRDRKIVRAVEENFLQMRKGARV